MGIGERSDSGRDATTATRMHRSDDTRRSTSTTTTSATRDTGGRSHIHTHRLANVEHGSLDLSVSCFDLFLLEPRYDRVDGS